jgi:hypothetical protein
MYRQYLTRTIDKEIERSKFEVKKASFLGSLFSGDASLKRETIQELNHSLSSYIRSLYFLEPDSDKSEERALAEYYERYIKNAKFSVAKDEDGSLKLNGSDQAFQAVTSIL